jgi:WD40 repeat protein
VGERETEPLLIDLASGVETTMKLDVKEWTNGGELSKVMASFSPDGTYLAVASNIGYAKLWDMTAGREIAKFANFAYGVHSAAFSPDEKRLATGSNGNRPIKIWDTKSFEELISLECQGSMFDATAWSPDGNILGAWNQPGVLNLWCAPSWDEIAAQERAQAAAPSP